jgi:N-acylneuraminate cytidylyltransferase
MRILAVIPARGGSKRLPGKNIRLLGGKPLIQWSIESALDAAPDVCDVLVSTDDEVIANVTRKAGAMVPWIRPSELATDQARTVDVCLHALDWYENTAHKVEGLLVLQPTSPFRNRETIQAGIRNFQGHPRSTILGVSVAENHPMWCFKIRDEALEPYFGGAGLEARSQDLDPAYVITGSFYLISPEKLRETKSFFSGEMVPLAIETGIESIDIDTELDWLVAEAALKIWGKGK